MLTAVDLDSPHRDAFTLTTQHLNLGFRENRRYGFAGSSDGKLLYIDDELIEQDSEGVWRWSPGFYAGVVTAEIVSQTGLVEASYRLDVAPSEQKLGADEFQSMLDQIWSFDERLVVGSEAATVAIGELGELQTPWLEYSRIRAHAPAFLKALRSISTAPIYELRTRREQLPPQYLRRADNATAVALLRNPTALGCFKYPDRAITATPFFDSPRVEETMDAPANRCVLAVARAVSRRALKLLEYFESAATKETGSATRTRFCTRWPRRRSFLHDLLAALRKLQRASPLAAVSRPEITAAGLNAVAADPVYGRAYRSGWRILRHGADGPPTGEDLWISPTWEVYERWCFVRLAKLLELRCGALYKQSGSGSGYSTTGKSPDGRTFKLIYQPTFPAGDQPSSSGFNSVSGFRQPDIALTVSGPSGEACIALDAKYRTSRENVLDAMSSAHIYRDALRHKGDRLGAALLLVPKTGGAPWLEDPEFIRRNRVGVLGLAPDAVDSSPLNQLFALLLT